MMDSKPVRYVEFYIEINLRNNASCWFLLQEYITMQGPLNVKLVHLFVSLHKFKYRYFINSLGRYFAEEFSNDGKQLDACHYSILPCIRVHEFQFHVLQLLLGFNSLQLQKVLESVSSCWQTHVTITHCLLHVASFVIWIC